jgi:hypothetical protein
MGDKRSTSASAFQSTRVFSSFQAARISATTPIDHGTEESKAKTLMEAVT